MTFSSLYTYVIPISALNISYMNIIWTKQHSTINRLTFLFYFDCSLLCYYNSWFRGRSLGNQSVLYCFETSSYFNAQCHEDCLSFVEIFHLHILPWHFWKYDKNLCLLLANKTFAPKLIGSILHYLSMYQLRTVVIWPHQWTILSNLFLF